jgi:hypothetical protein
MLLNLTAPVGQSASSSSYQQTARAEVVTNECCELTFEKDLLGSMMGVCSGQGMDLGGYDEDDDYADVSRSASKGSKKRKGKGGGGDSDDDSGTYDGDDDRKGSKGKGGTKRPKISTITNKSRKATGKGASKKGGKKVVKPKKKG